MIRFTVPDDFNPSESARSGFDGKPANNSSTWIKECADAILNDFDGLPIGVALEILRISTLSLGSEADRVAMKTIFRPGSPEFPGVQS